MKLYRLTEWIGRWSMLDVFVVALLAAVVEFGNLARVEPGPGIIAFALAVVLTMLAAPVPYTHRTLPTNRDV